MNKVLIIDDDTFLTKLYNRLLQSEGLAVDVANSGTEALDMLSESHPDLIVLDLHMPGMHGTDVLRAIREEESTKHIPVIVFATGYEKSLMAEVGCFGVEKVFSKMKCKPRVLVAEIKASLEELKQEESVNVIEIESSLDITVEQMPDPGKDQIPVWIERLRADDRIDARRVCLLHLYRIMQEDLRQALVMHEATSVGRLGRALKKLLEDLYDNPQLIRGSTAESLEQALHKLLTLTEKKRPAKSDSEAILQDVLKEL